MAETFQKIGYPASKVRYLVNRADAPAGSTRPTSGGRSAACPSTRSCRDGLLVVQSNNEGVPFVLANPDAAISKDVIEIARRAASRPTAIVATRRRPAGARQPGCPIRARSASSTPASAA